MTARAAVYSLLVTDPVLLAAPYNLNADRIWPNFSMDKSPRSGYFIIMRWGEWTRAFGDRGTQKLTIVGYASKQTSTDFTILSSMLIRVEDILKSAIHISGDDGWVLTCADLIQGAARSPDSVDFAYDALSKNSIFNVVSRKA